MQMKPVIIIRILRLVDFEATNAVTPLNKIQSMFHLFIAYPMLVS